MENNVKKIATSASWIMVGRIFQLGLTFISTMLVTRYLGPTEFGRMNYVYSYVLLFIPLCQMGLNSTVVKELADNKNDNEVLGTILVLRIIGAIVGMLCSIFVVSTLNNEGYTIIAILQSFALMFQTFDCLVSFYQANYLSKKSGLIYAISYILTSIFRIVAIILKKNIYWFAFATSLDYIVVAILLVIIYFKDGHRFNFSISMSKKLLKNSFHYVLSSIFIVIYGKVIDSLFLGRMISEAAVGYYAAATLLCNAWPFVLQAIIDSSSPMLFETYENNKEEFNKKLKQLYAMIFYIGIGVALLITIFARLIIMILYGESYSLSITPLRIVCWSSAFSYIGVARFIWLQCKGLNKYETIIAFFGAISSVVIHYLLIKYYGINGAALSLVLTELFTNFICLFFMKDTRENAKLILDAILLRGFFK